MRPIANAETELTQVEYTADLDSSDTTIEITFVFFIKRNKELRVEVGSHTTGLFPIATWESLLSKSGFEVERGDCPVTKGGRHMLLWAGRLAVTQLTVTHTVPLQLRQLLPSSYGGWGELCLTLP